MTTRTVTRTLAVLAVAALSTLGITTPALADDDVLVPGATLYVDPHSTTLEAAAGLAGQARTDAQILGSYASATWLTKGTPDEVQVAAESVASHATAAGAVPTFVVYNLPFRDCAQYSAGGALDTAAYEDWIDGVAAGIGATRAAIILEPDGLGIIPWYTDINGTQEWCRPAELDPTAAAADRFAQLNYAVAALTALPNTAVYLDGTHSGWLSVGDITDRLMKAGVADADGFFLNASNYIETQRLQKYGTWISNCLALSTKVSWWQPAWCASQYYPASPDDFSTWTLTDEKYATDMAGAGIAPDPATQAHFVIDTSRNGQGAWSPPPWTGDIEAWCNPPARGAGLRPTTDTNDPLIDAYLWIKVPGESDGQCYRGTGGPLDPIRGVQDPPAGVWFADQARELITLGAPTIAAPACHVSYASTKPFRGAFAGDIRIKNLGAAPINGWTLAWHWADGEKLVKVVGGDGSQVGDAVTVTSGKLTSRIKAGSTTLVAFIGKQATQRVEPWAFTLNGAPCTSD